MIEVHVLELPGHCVPEGDDWLSRGEVEVQAGLRFAKRRADWRLGRWTAKCCVSELLSTAFTPASMCDIEVRAAADGAPELFRQGEPLGLSISLSHSGGWGLCAAARGRVRLGCDIESIEPRSDAFAADILLPRELADFRHCSDPDGRLALLWSAKESGLKALRCGLRRDVREAQVERRDEPDQDGWGPLTVSCRGEPRAYAGWWRRLGDRVHTVLSDPAPTRPTERQTRRARSHTSLEQAI